MSKSKIPIYLDYNATTPIDRRVAEYMKPFLEDYFGNPSSSHAFGVKARSVLRNAREQVASLINCQPEEVIFTGGGTESNNLAIKGYAYKHRERGSHIITSSVEHPAVMEVCRYLEKNGFKLTILPVDTDGLVVPGSLERALQPDTILVSIMHANNETGTIQPIEEMAGICRSRNIAFHTDAAQSAGKIPVDVDKLGVQMLSIAGHKLYGPKGVGALYVRAGTGIEKILHGAGHEYGLRPGTENVMEIAGLGKACELAEQELQENMDHMALTRDMLWQGIQESCPGCKRNGSIKHSLPNTLNVGFHGVDADYLLTRMEGLAASAGAACHTDDVILSPVLRSMQVPEEYARGSIRFSVGKSTTKEEIDKSIERITKAYNELTAGLETDSSIDETEKLRLTQYTHGMGCACKLRPQDLENILQNIPVQTNPSVLVDLSTSDDAAVYRIAEDTALVVSLDFFTPIVDDPYTFGAIAAANALSDLYSMGAKPLFGLNIVGFPVKTLPWSVLEQILRGASDKAQEAGIAILGGHSIEDNEPKYGMVACGTVHPEKILRNRGAEAGDRLILTKAIGTGIISTATKRGAVDPGILEAANHTMAALNNRAIELTRGLKVHACTDVTGFGLAGHLAEMFRNSNTDAHITINKIPLLPGVKNLAMSGYIPGGTKNNYAFAAEYCHWQDKISKTLRYISCDAMTSGGLLLAMPENDAGKYLEAAEKAGLDQVMQIGEVNGKGTGKIFFK